MVIGNLTGEWLKYANGEAKKDKKQTLIGTVTFDATNRCLNIQVVKGAAKPTLLKKQAKEWLKKANVSLEILKGGKPMTDEEAETEGNQPDSDMPNEKNQKEKPKKFDWDYILAQGKTLYKQAIEFTKSKESELGQTLSKSLLSFFRDYKEALDKSGNDTPPPTLIAIKNNLTQIGEKIAESQVAALFQRLTKNKIQLN